MDSVSKIRRWVLREGRSIRSVSRQTGHSRSTIRKYLSDDRAPHYERVKPPVRHVLCDGFDDRLGELFKMDQGLPVRERRCGKLLYEQLVSEGYKGSYSTVQRYVRVLKQEAASEASLGAFVPLSFAPGDAMQFDWSHEWVELGGVDTKIKVAHFRLAHSRKAYVRAYLRESQEMVLDAFNQGLSFFGGVPRRVIIDNPKTMVVFVGKSKDRTLHPKFKAMLNHYCMEAVACTPASGWEKGQVENQVGYVRKTLFTPKLKFDDLESLNEWLALRCEELDTRAHPEDRERSVGKVFAEESGHLHPLGRLFDGYADKDTRARSTCLVQYDSNRYSVPSTYAGQKVKLRIYATKIKIACDGAIIAEHERSFAKNLSVFEPWHYVPILKTKPGALRDGAPFMGWQLPPAMEKIKDHYSREPGGDQEFVELLLLAQDQGIDLVQTACELAVEAGTLRLPAIINLVNQLAEPSTPLPIKVTPYPELEVRPTADCQRYEALYGAKVSPVERVSA